MGSYEADTPAPEHTPMPPSGDGGLSWWSKRWAVVGAASAAMLTAGYQLAALSSINKSLDELQKEITKRATSEAVEVLRIDLHEHVNELQKEITKRATSEAVEVLRIDLHEHVNPRNHPDNTARVDQLLLRVQILEATAVEFRNEMKASSAERQAIMSRLDRMCAAMPKCQP